ncbi:MAG: hypothetical protein RIC80_07615 [Cyclobacteriaceae bacterium]
MNFTEILLIIGGIALVVTVLVYPRDVFKTLFIGIPRAILVSILDKIWIILIPIWGPFWLLDRYFKWGVFNRAEMVFDSEYQYSGRKRKIDFNKFSAYILTTETNGNKVSQEILEATSTIQDLDGLEYHFIENEKYLIIELPKIEFFAFCLLIQCMKNQIRDSEVYGFAMSSRSSFFLYQDQKTTNNLIGKTNTNKSISVSLYDNLDKEPYLRMNHEIELNDKLTTEFFASLVKPSSK